MGVVAVEPALEMLSYRPANGHPAVRAVAEALPFFDHAFDAALATLTLHHWNDYPAALSEMRRVAMPWNKEIYFFHDFDHPHYNTCYRGDYQLALDPRNQTQSRKVVDVAR